MARDKLDKEDEGEIIDRGMLNPVTITAETTGPELMELIEKENSGVTKGEYKDNEGPSNKGTPGKKG